MARRARSTALSYLSSIGTIDRHAAAGSGRLVTAHRDPRCVGAGSEWIHLGVSPTTRRLVALYERLGFAMAATPGPDMVFVG